MSEFFVILIQLFYVVIILAPIVILTGVIILIVYTCLFDKAKGCFPGGSSN